MIISFDGNVYAGKTTLVEALAEHFGCTAIREHSLYLPYIPLLSHFGDADLDIQLRYLMVDHLRKSDLGCGVNFLDRSFVSICAHVYAMYRIGQPDIRRRFFEIFSTEIGNQLIPERYCFVSCDYPVSLGRCDETNNDHGTDFLYLTEDYSRAVAVFNGRWIEYFGGMIIDVSNQSCALLFDVFEKLFLKGVWADSGDREKTLKGLECCLFPDESYADI